MGQKSSIDRLPSELRIKLIELLQNPSVTQKEIVELINTEAGENVVSKSSVNRYKLRMDKFAAKTREAREVADIYIEKYGTENRNKLGKVANEYIRLMVFDLITELEDLKDNGGEVKPENLSEIIYKVSRAIKELEQADKLNAQRETEIKAAAMKEAAEKVESVCKQKGVSKESMDMILREVFNIQ
ncbi:phage protein Gp27 family protein [Treponema pectinovorum]|uniref:phage protein Gp27 family protein n=1 Tax=Treponema pectinovorum TaxID=164 RepID=UPI0011CCD923|nr:phage protein Gp27 family protein [Treponema pectinovorum]